MRAAWAALARAAQKVPGGIARVSERAIGRWNWQPPAWLAWSRRRVAQAVCYVAADKKRAGIVLIALVGIAGGWLWYKSRPVPHYVTYTISAPGQIGRASCRGRG